MNGVPPLPSYSCMVAYQPWVLAGHQPDQSKNGLFVSSSGPCFQPIQPPDW